MTINEKDITFSSTSYWDPTGRVFFAQGRVFRAIENGMVSRVRKFLDSDLYKELRSKDYFVETWETSDVKIKGYELIVEHEKISPMPDYQLLCFAELRNIYKFLIDIQDICSHHGYNLLDAGASNVGYKNGNLCFLDLGSFFGESAQEFYKSLAPNVYLLKLYAKGQYEIVHTIKPEQLICTAYYPQTTFASQKSYMHEIHDLVAYYDVYRRVSAPNSVHFKIRTKISINIILKLNQIARNIFKKPETWCLFKMYPNYKQVNKHILEGINSDKLYESKNSLPIEDSKVIESAISQKKSIAEPKSIFIYGNYSIDVLKKLAMEYSKSRIYACTPDCAYADQMFNMIRSHGETNNLFVLNWSPSLNIFLHKIKELEIDLFMASEISLKRDWRINFFDDNRIRRIFDISKHIILELNNKLFIK